MMTNAWGEFKSMELRLHHLLQGLLEGIWVLDQMDFCITCSGTAFQEASQSKAIKEIMESG